MHRIQNLAADVSRFHGSPTLVIADTDVTDPLRQAWQEQADPLHAALTAAEEQARAAGVDLTWIDDARTVGSHQGTDPQTGAVRRVPLRELGIERFFLDLLDLDLWQLERMAALDTALPVRASAAHGVLTGDSARDLALFEHMHVRFSRASSLVAAVQLTPEEGERMWGTGAEPMRRMHAAAIDQMSDLQLLEQWQEYADADARLRMPPYRRQDPDTGKFLAGSLTEPPSPRQMIARAALMLYCRDPEGADHPGVPQSSVSAAAAHRLDAAEAIGAAVDATNTDTGAVWAPDPGSEPDPATPGYAPGHEPGVS
ncbi:hypothetical protein [Nocardia fluminea]|uniref:hypothetical protein n=1 Tax=Nocardia fluminea TaxID=134984 RepID=UPI00364D8558